MSCAKVRAQQAISRPSKRKVNESYKKIGALICIKASPLVMSHAQISARTFNRSA